MRSISFGLVFYFFIGRTIVQYVCDYYFGVERTAAFTYPYPVFFSPVAILMSYFYIVKPLRKINHVMNQFKIGAFEERLHIKRNDEIGNIADTFNDLASRLQLLIQSERHMTSNMGHEIRTPLTRMTWHLNNLRDRVDVEKSIDFLEYEIKNLANISSKMLKIAQIERSEFKPQLVDVQIHDLIHEVIDKTEGIASANHCRVEFHSDFTLTARTEKDLLEIVIDNIVHNAIQYTSQHSVIQIVLHVDPVTDFFEISVRDQGLGVPENTLERIFLQFERVDQSRNKATGGTGLGLALCRSIAKALGGSIKARNLEQGFEILFRVPLNSLPPS
jgi:signal transduction histidine kinase